MARWFTLHTDPDNTGGTSFSLDVVVHANVSAMRQAARRHDPNHCGGIAGAGGCFQAEPLGGRATHLGVVRLCADYANPLVVIHEAEHAGVALAHKLAEGRAYLVLSPHSEDERHAETEEHLAQATHELALAMLTELGLVEWQEVDVA